MLRLLRRRTATFPLTFQQTCRSANSRRASQNRSSTSDSESPAQWFEQDIKSGRLARVSENPEQSEARVLRQKIRQLEDELSAYQAQEGSEAYTKTILDSLEPDERERVRQAIAERSQKQVLLAEELHVRHEPSPMTGPLIKRFNTVLSAAAADSKESSKHRRELWLWYVRAKSHVPGFASMLPHKAWDVLWRTQVVDTLENRNRNSHVLILVDDILSAGQVLSRGQTCLRLDALVDTDRSSEAVAVWKSEYEQNPASHPDAVDLEHSIKLFARLDDTDKVMTLTRDFFHHYPDSNPRILQTVIDANASAGNHKLAFAAYLVMRSKLRTEMSMADYDACISTFLRVDNKDLALAVFRDMMSQGRRAIDLGAIHSESENALQSAFSARLNNLLSRSSGDEISNVALSSLGALPRKWQNKFFYASWLKRLLGEARLDQASQVVDLMLERNVAPDAIHINGLIGAYLRSGEQEYQEKGEQMALGMIGNRVAFVNSRRAKRGSIDMTVQTDNTTRDENVNDASINARLPIATPETFNVLALFYTVKQSWTSLRFLQKRLIASKIQMPVYFLNKLLTMQSLNNGPLATFKEFLWHYTGGLQGAEAMRFLIGISDSRTGIVKRTGADVETFEILWTETLKHAGFGLNRTSMQTHQEFPHPRVLLHALTTWHARLSSKQAHQARLDVTREMYVKVIQAFIVMHDYEGCLVSMHVLSTLLGAFPDNDAVRVLAQGIADSAPDLGMGESRPVRMRARRSRALSRNPQREGAVMGVVQALAERRAEAGRRAGKELVTVVDKGQGQENLNLLSELVRVVMVRSETGSRSAQDIEASIKGLTARIGMPGLATGDVDASNVA